MDRRTLFCWIAAAAAVQPLAAAASERQRIPLKKAFRNLDTYLSLPRAEREHFYITYIANRDQRHVSDVRAAIVSPQGERSPISLDRYGTITTLPTLTLIRGDGVLEIEPDPGEVKFSMELRAATRPGAQVDARELALAVGEAQGALGKIAGALAFMAPKVEAAFFAGAGSGQITLADGQVRPLPTHTFSNLGVSPYLQPSAFAGARSVTLARAPTRIVLGPIPK